VKLLVGERRFREFRDDSLTVTGPFEALTSVTPTAGQQNANLPTIRASPSSRSETACCPP
jgi:hypothetical protein